MEAQEQGQPLMRKDDFSEEVISQILEKGINQKKGTPDKELKVVTHIVHVILQKESNKTKTEKLGPAVKSCNICKDVIGGHHIVKKHSYLETSASPYMCGICGEAFGRGYLLKIHLEVEHGFLEETSNRRSLRNKKNQGKDRLRQSVGTNQEAGVSKESVSKVTTPTGKRHTDVDLDSTHDKENEFDDVKQSIPTPDKTILLTSNGGENLVENEIDAPLDKDNEQSSSAKETYKNGDLIVINLFTEGGAISPRKKSGRKKTTKRAASGTDKYQCEFCYLGFGNQQQRGIHIKQAHPHCLLKCETCGMEFEERRRLTTHLKSHAKVRPPPKPKEIKKNVTPECTVCKKTFLHASGLQIHTQNFHPEKVEGQKYFCCEKCGSMFWTKQALVEHQRIHLDIKQFVCSYCKKGFVRRSDLKSHTKVHTGEKPFQCTYCERTFRQRLQMVHHIRTHTGEKPYKCDFCEKAFAKRDQFKRHRRVHTEERPYKCAQCEKCFKSQGNLKAHERTHTGVKPYKCKHCDKAFAQYSNVIHHERTHTGLKPYPCTKCDKAFPRSNSLQAHMKSHNRKPCKISTVKMRPLAAVQPDSIHVQPAMQHELQLSGPPGPQQNIFHDLSVHQNTDAVIATASEILASMSASIVASLGDVTSVPQQDLECNLVVGTQVQEPVSSFISGATMAGYGGVEHDPSTACESIAVVLSNMGDYQHMGVPQNSGLANFQ